MARPYRILSLSGGGVRGIFQAVYLQKIAEDPDFEKPFRKNFDLIAGTSTGAIIALAIARGTPLEKIVHLYTEKGREIFTPQPPSDLLSRLVSVILKIPTPDWLDWKTLASFLKKVPQYSTKSLTQALEDVFGKDTTLGECKTKYGVDVCIFATRLDETAEKKDKRGRELGYHRIFSTFDRPRQRQMREDRRDVNQTIVSVALSSCAAPTYFAAVNPPGWDSWYLDGGAWANTSSLFALLEAYIWGKQEFRDIRMLSLGNGRYREEFNAKEYNNARKKDIWKKHVYDMWFLPQSSAADDFSDSLLNRRRDDDFEVYEDERYFEVSLDLDKRIELDDWKKANDELPKLAETMASDDLGRRRIKKLLLGATETKSWAGSAS